MPQTLWKIGLSLFAKSILPVFIFSLANLALLLCALTVILSKLLASAFEMLLDLLQRAINGAQQRQYVRREPTTLTVFSELLQDSFLIVSTFRPVTQKNPFVILDALCPRIFYEPDAKKVDEPTCIVCLETVQPKAIVRTLKCSHVFHAYVLFSVYSQYERDFSLHIHLSKY